MTRDKRTAEKVGLVTIHRNPTVVTGTFWYTGCQYLNHSNKKQIIIIIIIIIMKSYTKYKKQTFKQSTPRDGRKQLTNRAPFNHV